MAVTVEKQDSVVEAIGLTKVFKDFWGRPKARAVNGVNFTVRRGQVFGLLGPNGSGKSTTVKMILGLLYPTRGTLKVFGQPPTDVATKQRIGYLPEESYLYRYLTAAETIDFFGALFGLSADERQRRTEQLLDMVGLENSKNRPVGEFSKGMARRIGLAQALVNDPSLVILDEPTAGLDPVGCKEVKDVIRLLASRGKSIILCSHLLADVEDVCDDVVVLYGGKIRSEGRLKDLLTVEDSTRILAPKLPQDVIQKVQALLQEQVDVGKIKIDSPSMNLEQFFLDVVNSAQTASVETAGAKGGGKIAEYLLQTADELDTTDADSKRILQALQEHEKKEEESTIAAEEEEPVTETPAVDNEKLEQLAHSDDATEPDLEPEPDENEKRQSEQEDYKKVSDKLQDLMSKKSSDK